MMEYRQVKPEKNILTDDEKQALRAEHGRQLSFSQWLENYEARLGITRKEYQPYDLLELADIYYEGCKGILQPSFQISMYYLARYLNRTWKDVEIYEPVYSIPSGQRRELMEKYYAGLNYWEAKEDTKKLADRWYPAAIEAMWHITANLEEKEERDSWKKLDQALNPRYDKNPATVLAEAVRGGGQGKVLESLYELLDEKEAVPAFPADSRVYELIYGWTIRLLEYEAYSGSGYAMRELYKLYDRKENKEQSKRWQDMAVSVGYAEALNDKYHEFQFEATANFGTSAADDSTFEMAGAYADMAAAAGILSARGLSKDMKFLKKKSVQTRRFSIEADVAASKKLVKYQEELDRRERMFNIFSVGMPVSAEDVGILGAARQNADLINLSSIETLNRETAVKDYKEKLILEKESEYAREANRGKTLTTVRMDSDKHRAPEFESASSFLAEEAVQAELTMHRTEAARHRNDAQRLMRKEKLI